MGGRRCEIIARCRCDGAAEPLLGLFRGEITISGRGAMQLTARIPRGKIRAQVGSTVKVRELQRRVIFKGPDDLVSSLQNVVYENHTRLGGLM